MGRAQQHIVTSEAASEAQATPDLILLHGWGSTRRCWDALLAELCPTLAVAVIDLPGYDGERDHVGSDFAADLDAVLESMLPQLPARAAYLGWSLGGAVAAWLAHRYPQRVSALITLAWNPCFVQGSDQDAGMDRSSFDAFAQRVEQDRDDGLRYFTTLQALGDDNQRGVRRALRDASAMGEVSHNTLRNGLNVLRDTDLRDTLSALSTPTLAIFGDRDQLVPHAVAHHLPDHVSRWLCRGAAHAPQLSRPAAVAARVIDFVCQREPHRGRRSKQGVAASFGAAENYDAVAQLQRDTGERLLAQLPQRPIARLLDLGSGSGHHARALARVAEQFIGVDIAEGMLRRARERASSGSWLCGDAEQLPIAPNSIDVLFSNLMIQWSEDLPALAAGVARVLQPGGEAHFATLGPDTLWEFRAAWRAVDDAAHVNRFRAVEEVLEAFADAGLMIRASTRELWIRRSANTRSLARELKQLGARNVNPDRRRGLTGKQRWQQLEDRYRTFGDGEDSIPVSWEVVFLSVEKPC